MVVKKNIILISLMILSWTVSQAEKPDFLLVGVTKCGTTSLYRYLTEHPRIQGANQKKEIHFFDIHFSEGLNWYEQQLPVREPGKLVGEGTPGYFWKDECLERIFAYCPQVKIIVIFRDPVKRIISEYLRRRITEKEKRGFNEAIFSPDTQSAYLNAGKYIMHLQRWLKFFSRNQILILISEEVWKNPEEHVNRTFNFLGLENYTLASYINYNKTKDSIEIDEKTLKVLKDIYAPFNKKLEEFLGRKLPWG